MKILVNDMKYKYILSGLHIKPTDFQIVPDFFDDTDTL